MATLRDIRRRITSIRSTEQITKAMKMVAAAKLRKAQIRILEARPYAHRLNEVLGHVAARVDRSKHPLMHERLPHKICYVVVTADRGLCGSFNSNIIRKATEELSRCDRVRTSLFLVGRKGRDHFKKFDWPIIGERVDFFRDLAYEHAKDIAHTLIKQFIEKKADRIFLVYNEFKSAVRQEIIVEQLLPIEPVEPEQSPLNVDFLYEPSPDAVLEEICPKNVNIQIWRVLLESSAAEQGARMVAMEGATDSANDMIRSLTLHYNKVRQATITKELTEIVGGADALKSQ